jgi:hypothetical protein
LQLYRYWSGVHAGLSQCFLLLGSFLVPRFEAKCGLRLQARLYNKHCLIV